MANGQWPNGTQVTLPEVLVTQILNENELAAQGVLLEGVVAVCGGAVLELPR